MWMNEPYPLQRGCDRDYWDVSYDNITITIPLHDDTASETPSN